MVQKIIFDQKVMAFMKVFDYITHAQLKDCVNEPSYVLFIVDPGQMAKAIGKGGINVKKLEKKLGKKIKIAEFSDNALQFAGNLMFPAKIKDSERDGNTLIFEAENTASRGIMIGRGASHLRKTEEIVKRYFEIDEIKIK